MSEYIECESKRKIERKRRRERKREGERGASLRTHSRTHRQAWLRQIVLLLRLGVHGRAAPSVCTLQAQQSPSNLCASPPLRSFARLPPDHGEAPTASEECGAVGQGLFFSAPGQTVCDPQWNRCRSPQSARLGDEAGGAQPTRR